MKPSRDQALCLAIEALVVELRKAVIDIQNAQYVYPFRVIRQPRFEISD